MEFTYSLKSLNAKGRPSEQDSSITGIDVANWNVIILVFKSVLDRLNWLMVHLLEDSVIKDSVSCKK